MDKYLDTSTVKTSKKFYKTTLTSDMIFTKADAYISDEKIKKLTRELNNHYRACIGSLIYLLSTRLYLYYVVQKLSKFNKILVKCILKDWYIYLDTLWTKILWA